MCQTADVYFDGLGMFLHDGVKGGEQVGKFLRGHVPNMKGLLPWYRSVRSLSRARRHLIW